MALSTNVFPSTAATDSRSALFGYNGLLSGLHEPMVFEFGSSGISSVTGVALAVACSVDLAFDVVERDNTGASTVVQSGVLAAGTLQADASALALSVQSFVMQATRTYALRLSAYPEVGSTLVPNAVALSGIPDDGASGLVATVTTSLV